MFTEPTNYSTQAMTGKKSQQHETEILISEVLVKFR